LFERAQAWWSDAEWRRRLDAVWVELVALLERFVGRAGMAERSAQMLADEWLEQDVRREIELVHAMDLFYSGRVREAHELVGRMRPVIPLGSHHDERVLIARCVISFESGQAMADIEREMVAVVQ
jgi:hypothetical protein